MCILNSYEYFDDRSKRKYGTELEKNIEIFFYLLLYSNTHLSISLL